MKFVRYSRLAINLEKALHEFVELMEKNLLMYNIKHFKIKSSPAIRLKIVVQMDRRNRFRNELQIPFK